MQLSQTAEYALRAVVYLAGHKADPQTNQQIADGCRMPAGYLAKVLQPLAKAGIVSAQRGLGGGYVLERDAQVLSLLDVIGAVEPVQRIRCCPLKINGHGVRLCALHQTLDDAMAAVEKTLGAQTIANILVLNGVRPLCENPAAGSAPIPLNLGLGSRKATTNGNGHSNGHTNGNGAALGSPSAGTEAVPDGPHR